jgi:hypothetical protein
MHIWEEIHKNVPLTFKLLFKLYEGLKKAIKNDSSFFLNLYT